MAAFIIYDTATGKVKGTYLTLNHDDATTMSSNTPTGCSALALDPTNPVFSGTASWQVVNGAPIEIVPTIAEQLAAAQVAQNTVIELSYQNDTYNTPVSYMNTTFWADQNSQSMLTGALTVLTPSGSTPAGFSWWDATNNAVPMTLAQLQGLALAILNKVNTNFVKRKTLLAQIKAATTVAQAQAVAW